MISGLGGPVAEFIGRWPGLHPGFWLGGWSARPGIGRGLRPGGFIPGFWLGGSAEFTGEFSWPAGYNSYVDNMALVQFWPFRGILRKSVLMRKTIVINTLLILGYYLVLQLLIWISMVLR